MFLTEYNEKKVLEMERREGAEMGSILTLIKLVKKGLLTIEQAAEEMNMTVAEFNKAAEDIKETA